MKIKIPAAGTIFQSLDSNEIYIYRGFNREVNGHIMFSCDGPYITFVATCHNEFETNYCKIGKL